MVPLGADPEGHGLRAEQSLFADDDRPDGRADFCDTLLRDKQLI